MGPSLPLASAYYRPGAVAEAQQLLTGENRVALAGGTIVNADREHGGIEVVDLQALGLATIAAEADRLTLGAMVTLSTLARDERVPEALGAIARAELPSTMRTRATVGGTIAAAATSAGVTTMGIADSVLAAGFLAHDGVVHLADGSSLPLAQLFASGLNARTLITAISIDPSGVTATASTGRTPADVPIVAAVARSTGDTVTVALTGVAATPALVDPDDPAAGLEPPSDFRGSADYRRTLAATLTNRAVEATR